MKPSWDNTITGSRTELKDILCKGTEGERNVDPTTKPSLVIKSKPRLRAVRSPMAIAYRFLTLEA